MLKMSVVVVVAGIDLCDCCDTENIWRLAQVLKRDGNRLLIHYVDWNTKWDEWMLETDMRIQPMRTQTYGYTGPSNLIPPPVVLPVDELLRDPAFLLSPSESNNKNCAQDIARVVCCVCMLILKEPANIECGHTACRGCLALGKCVHCTVPLPTGALSINYELQRTSAQLLRRCPYQCSVSSLNLAAMKAHLESTCRLALVECWVCKARFPRATLEAHLQHDCSQRRIKCISCNEFFTETGMVQHERTSAIGASHTSDVIVETKHSAFSADYLKGQASAPLPSLPRGCNNMMICVAECVDPSTRLPWMFHRRHQHEHRFVCTVEQHHCDFCCTLDPKVVRSQSNFPSACKAHLIVGREAFDVHLKDKATEHAHLQMTLNRQLMAKIEKLEQKATLTGDKLPVRPKSRGLVFDLSEFRITWASDVHSKRKTLHSQPTVAITILREACSNRTTIFSWLKTPVPDIVIRLAICRPMPSDSHTNFDPTRGALLPAAHVSHTHPIILWTGEWQELAMWLTDKYQLCLADCTMVLSCPSPAPASAAIS
jgi:hypothetical protein